ncbi:acetylcholine receptor subunit beta-type acr-2-like [Aricia agestis]|uniref:acetylcholine receptor subunit beta-type acr-2-like n=1 Tax=Aricia agestis TaxID=91739 RepID=UPI001C209CBA|nr:acetylcholine receptor subunit beta-type acr-2-like [Aricia agestis]
MIILMCFIAIFIHVSSSECNKRTPTWEEKLRRDIPNYILHPNQQCVNSTVAIHFNLRYYTFDEKTQEFYIYSYMMLKWFDDSLKWNPKDYGGIDRTTVRTAMIWTPKIIQMDDDSDIFISLHNFYTSSCMVYHDGTVTCIPEMRHSGECQSRMKDWPYDTHICQIKFVEKDVRITRNGTTGISTKDAKESAGWNIILSAYTESDEKPDEITLTFVIKRAADGLAAIFVIPLIVIAALNITAILIDIDNILRVHVLVFCLISCVNFVTENYPKFGSDVPKILIFLRTSFFLSALSIFFTYIFKNLRKKTNPPPS